MVLCIILWGAALAGVAAGVGEGVCAIEATGARAIAAPRPIAASVFSMLFLHCESANTVIDSSIPCLIKHELAMNDARVGALRRAGGLDSSATI
jgi:hypothetical protein